MRFQQLTPTGVTDVEVDSSGILCSHRANTMLTANPETMQANGLALMLHGHTSDVERRPGTSVALIDAETAAQIVHGIEAAICDAPSDMQHLFLAELARLRGGH